MAALGRVQRPSSDYFTGPGPASPPKERHMSELTVLPSLKCPNCGAVVDGNMARCEYCDQPVVLLSLSSLSSLPLQAIGKYAKSYRDSLADLPASETLRNSLGLCYLKLGLFDRARDIFEKAISEKYDEPELYFFAALSLLNGRKPFAAKRAVIDAVLRYVNSALKLDERSIYYYLQAYVKYDYFERKCFNTDPPSKDVLELARSKGLSAAECEQMFEIIGSPCPDALKCF
jgi:tetratricopeptide (TPR) repeat protein